MKRSSSNTNATTTIPNAANSMESAKLGAWACGSKDDRSLAVTETLPPVERIFIPETVDRTKLCEELSQDSGVAIGEHRGYRNNRLNLQPNRYRSSGWDRHQTAAPQ